MVIFQTSREGSALFSDVDSVPRAVEFKMATGCKFLSLAASCKFLSLAASIRQAVAEELKKQSESKTKESEVNGGEEASTSNPTQRTERTVNRLSGLLNRIRNRGGARANGGASKNRKKPRTDKEHRIQI